MKDIEKDKRLIIPGDAFEEEASEGLGGLRREEAEADLRELKGRMERRLRKPRMIWLPAAAAVMILLVASAMYVSIFRDRSTDMTDLAGAGEAKADSLLIAMAEDVKADTALIAMAEPIQKREGRSGLSVSELRTRGDVRSSEPVASARPGAAGAVAVVVPEEADVYAEELLAFAENVKKEAEAEEVSEVVVAEARHEEPAAEEVIVAAVPMMQKAALREKGVREEQAALEMKTASGVNAAVKKRAAARDEAAATTVTGGAVARVTDRDPLPAGGYDEFTKWLQENTRYPTEVEPRARQVVVVTFMVRADSTVYDLKAERTAGDLFTLEAFRLIREGPKWQPAVRGGQVVEEEVRVSIVFK